jgi:DNA polymerase-1
MKHIVVDCNALCHQVKFTLRGLSHGDWPTGVIYGFLMRILKFSDDFKTRQFAFMWDSPYNLRKEIYPDYKKKRGPDFITEEDKELNNQAYPQFNLLYRAILPTLGFVNNYREYGYEADDLIASFVKVNGSDKHIVVSSDNDLYQLLDYCDMYLSKRKTIYTNEDLLREKEVSPHGWLQVKTIAGCDGDGVPGLKGVREKTAINYMKGRLPSKKEAYIYNYLHSEEAEITRRLVDLPFENTPPIYGTHQPILSMDKVIKVCDKYGCYSLLEGVHLNRWRVLCHQRGV